MSDPVHIGLGSNLGDREAALLQAVDALRSIDGVSVLAASSLYDSAPLGPDQPRFLNAVVAVDC
ncbi:MAG: 2-amino-4-hydroxy-6-hydroxymethyldihydropteridine diphosphokinase, partial [Myxococcota bacterium]|nr:2-amino-4-hydroxy-6-hydroxymethyldihydropteridine diphosphokinase [Myxococcota bacterium]